MSEQKISLKFGFLGLGMGGCAIAAECANKSMNEAVQELHPNYRHQKNKPLVAPAENYPYRAILVNTNTNDFEKIVIKKQSNVSKIQLQGFENGAARDLAIGEKAFTTHQDYILQTIQNDFRDRDFIWIVCGLGGGTGTGSILKAVELLMNNGFQKKFGLLLTLPRNEEALTVLENATKRIQSIAKFKDYFGSIVFIDNAKLYRKFESEKPDALASEYSSYSNRYVADFIHELNLVTSFKPFSDTHFDASELEGLLKTSGVLSFAKLEMDDKKIDLANPKSYLDELNSSLQEGVLYDTDLDDLKHAKRSSLSMITSKTSSSRLYTYQFLKELEQFMSDVTPYVEQRPVAPYVNDEIGSNDRFRFYSLISGLPFPKRIVNMMNEIQRIQREREELKAQKDNVLESLFSFSVSSDDQTPDLTDNFSFSSSSNVATATKEKDDFAFDF